MNIISSEGAKVRVQEMNRLGDARELQKGDLVSWSKEKQIRSSLLRICLLHKKSLIFCERVHFVPCSVIWIRRSRVVRK